MAAPCRIELLGWLRVEQNGQWVTRFRTQKTGALLAYLAFYRQRSVPREELIELLWPEDDTDTGRHKLRVALSSLRQQFRVPGEPSGSLIVANRTTAQLNPRVGTTDVAEFETALQAARSACSAVERVQLLAEAVERYRGELLPGYYEEWVDPERQRLAGGYLQALRQLIRDLEESRDIPQALDYARRAVAAHPLQEEAHRDLMRLLAADGQLEAALRQYRALENLLAQELDQAPAPATRDLAREIAARIYRPASPASTEEAPPARPGEIRPSSPAPSPPPPTGTVTFLLAEIVRSTGPLERTPEAAREAPRNLLPLLCGEILRHEGHVITETERVVVAAFERASHAAAAAVAGQRALTNGCGADPGTELAVRMALHTGEVDVTAGEYSGRALDDATRVLLAAHGGQILCSEATVSLFRGNLERDQPAFHLADLGLYRLRNMASGAAESERLFQVRYPELLSREFPPPRARPIQRSHLPLPLARYFGRETEIAQLGELLGEAAGAGGERTASGPQPREGARVEAGSPRLDSPGGSQSRLITVTGPGGSGKTTLALAVADRLFDEFEGAIRFVPLVDLTDARSIVPTLRDCLCPRPTPDREPFEQVLEAVSSQRTLLILDNFEHLATEGAPIVQTLLARAPTLTVLVTSRQRLGLAGEREFSLLLLPTPRGPESPEQLLGWPSVQLFVDRAQSARPDFQLTAANAADVAALCERLEGLPLAIELAAAKAQVLTPAQMLARLEQRLDLLVVRPRDFGPGAGGQERHRSLRAALEWSYRLLSPQAQRFFARLSVFRGGWALEAAEAVCQNPEALEYLEQLRESSLLLVEEVGEAMRYRLLESLREYGAEQLSPEERTTLAQRHARWYLAVAEQAAAEPGHAEQATWLKRLEREHANFRAALEWARENRQAEVGLRLGGALWWFWYVRGHWAEGQEHLAALLALPESLSGPAARARALHGIGMLAHFQGEREIARARLEEGLAIWRELNNDWGIAQSLSSLALLAQQQSDLATARSLCDEGLPLCWKLGNKSGLAFWLHLLGDVAARRGDRDAAHLLYEEGLALLEESGDQQGIAVSLHGLVHLALQQGDQRAARALLEESLSIERDLGHKPGMARSLFNLAELALYQGDWAAAHTLYEESLAIRRDLDDRRSIAECLAGLAALAGAQGRSERSARLFGAADALRDTRDPPLFPPVPGRTGRPTRAARMVSDDGGFGAAWAQGRSLELELAIAYALEEMMPL